MPRDTPLFTHALIVDDHPLFCEALAMTLRAVAGLVAVTTAGCLADALAAVAQEPAPDLIVLDLNLPDVTGIDGLIRLRRLVPDVPVLIVSSLTDARVVAACRAAGAAGFVPKHAPREAFRAACAALRAGHRVWPDHSADPSPASPRDDAIGRLGLLTPQQGRILQLVCEGKLNKQIAWELSIAETTVKAHVTAIMRKLGVQSRTQAVLIARETHFSQLVPEQG